MKMHLENKIFNLVKNNIKDIEIRLNDEKRKKLKIGDNINVINKVTNEEIIMKVINLEYFFDFESCIDNYEIKRLYNEDITKGELLNLLYSFYTKEEEKKYGVVAIIFEVV